MQLEGRELSEGMEGSDVERLQSELARLGYTKRVSGRFDRVTKRAVAAFQRAHGLEPHGKVDERTAVAINAEFDELSGSEGFVVRGTVSHVEGHVVTGATVQAFDHDMRPPPEVLGRATTTAVGSYEIRYVPEQFKRAEKQRADLRVVVLSDEGSELAASPVRFNAKPVEIVDLVVGERPALSEWKRYHRLLPAVTQGVRLTELTDDDLEFLRNELEVPLPHLVQLRRAALFANETELSEAMFYGCLREGLPSTLSSWSLLPAARLSRALETAIRRNTIPSSSIEQVASFVGALQRQLRARVIDDADDPARPRLSRVLDATRLSAPQREAVLRLHSEHEGDNPSFWQELSEQAELDEASVSDLQLTSQLSALVGDSPTLVRELNRSSGQEASLSSLSQLVSLERDAWQGLLASLPDDELDGLLENVPGETRDERLTAYRNRIQETLEVVFPTEHVTREMRRTPDIDLAAIRRVVELNPGIDLRQAIPEELTWGELDSERTSIALNQLRDEIAMFPDYDYARQLSSSGDFDNPVRVHTARFLDGATDLDIVDTNIDRYLADHPDSTISDLPEADRGAVVRQIKRLQRVARIAPRVAGQWALLKAGLDSALAVARLTEESILQYSRELGGDVAALHTLANAQQIAAANTVLVANAQQELAGARPFAIFGNRSAAEAVKEVANWPAMFGRLDFCACRHCQSVYSPAAYFVDLLQFLATAKKNQHGLTPLDVLVGHAGTGVAGRRPDLPHIPLTCDNTNSTLPYVDLVLEILEYFVTHDGALGPDAARDTTGLTVDELAINPQYIIHEAYAELQEATSGPLPFNRSLEVVRTYLTHLGASRHRVMRTFQMGSTPTDDEIAIESLGLSPQEAAILVGSSVPAHALYGYDSAVDWITDVVSVPNLLGRLGIEYSELLALLDAQFVNPGAAVEVVLVSADTESAVDTCNLSNLALDTQAVDDAFLSRLARFTRLRRHMDVSVGDLDALLTSLGITELDTPALVKLAVVRELIARTRLRPAPLAAFWANIPTRGERSLYRELFENRAVLKPYDASAFELAPDELELANPGQPLAPHVPAIAAALRTTEGEFEAIAEHAGLSQLDLASLSAAYRHVSLARALKLRPLDLIALLKLSGGDPFAAGEPAATAAFIDVVEAVKDAGTAVAELDYLIRHVDRPERPYALDEPELRRLAQTLRGGLVAIVRDTEPAPDPTAERLRDVMASVWESAVVEALMGIVLGDAVYSAELTALPALTLSSTPTDKLSYDPVAKQLKVTGELTEGASKLLADLSTDLAFRTALVELRAGGVNAEASLTAAPAFGVGPQGARIRYQSTTKRLSVAGPLTNDERALLESLSSDGAYLEAVAGIYDQPRRVVDDTLSGIVDGTLAKAEVLDESATTTERAAFLMPSILEHVRDTRSRAFVIQTLAARVGVDEALCKFLLESLLALSPTDTSPLDTHFLAVTQTGLSSVDLSGPPRTVWSGLVVPETTETYTIFLSAPDEVRLSIDGEPVIDSWQSQPLTEHSTALELTAGRAYALTLELANPSANDSGRLSWQSESIPKAEIGPAHFVPGAVYEKLASAFQRLSKAARIVSKLDLSIDALSYVAENSAQFDDADLNALPLSRETPVPIDAGAPALFAGWLRLQHVAERQRELRRNTDIAEMFSAAANSATPSTLSPPVRDVIAGLTGWDAAHVESLASGFGLHDEDFRTETALGRLAAAMDVSKRLGVSPAKLFDWAAAVPDSAHPEILVEDVVNTTKAKYDDEAWKKVAKPLNDAIRDKQREALVARAGAMLGTWDSNQLFEHLLIDVEMTSCMDTSRIKQAISSVQLFVQRCLMNLEDRGNDPHTVLPAALDSGRWRWMKQYRVWEANRKIFLYPENWIEPDLRDNKTPFFRSIESAIKQEELSPRAAEKALEDYLVRLDEVARLEIVGLHWEKTTLPRAAAAGSSSFASTAAASFGSVLTRLEASVRAQAGGVLHVFGRTFNAPHRYFYRRLLIEDDEWTPWEAVDLDIEAGPHGVHLVPVVYNRRLFVFWPLFEEKPVPESNQHRAWREQLEALEQLKSDAVSVEEQARKHRNQIKAYADAEIGNTFEPDKPEEVEAALALQEAESAYAAAKAAADAARDAVEAHEALEPLDSARAEAKYWEVKLAFSEHDGSQWSPRQVSEWFVPVPYPWVDDVAGWRRPHPSEITFAAAIYGDVLNIDVNVTPPANPNQTDQGQGDVTDTYGVFWMDGCRNRLYVYWDARSGPGNATYLGPLDSTIHNESFAQDYAVTGELKSPFLRLKLYNPENDTAKDPSLVPDFVHQAILDRTPTRFQVVFPHKHRPYGPRVHLGDWYPFIYQDLHRAYLAVPHHRKSTATDAARPLRFKKEVGLAMASGSWQSYAMSETPLDAARASMSQTSDLVTNSSSLTRRLDVTEARSMELVRSAGLDMTRPVKVGYAPESVFRPQPIYPIDTLRFSTLFHPHVCDWMRDLRARGVASLLTRHNQSQSNDPSSLTRFAAEYRPTFLVHPDRPREDVDFRQRGAYSVYNWELFFHAPMLIAQTLMRNQKFEEAQAWFHYVFDPTVSNAMASPERYWNFLPFFRNSDPASQQIQALLDALSDGDPDVARQVKKWRDNPFNPHLIARMRITAYQKYVVMKYLDNLLAWADKLFRRDSIESINEATQLYVLAANILGPKPEEVPETKPVGPETYDSLRQRVFDPFSNVVVEMENVYTYAAPDPNLSDGNAGAETALGETFYFCIPRNQKLLDYWDTIADRLFKIRHCMNIEGVRRQLPLFEPPIDPALLVKAFAKGIDISSVLDDLHAPLPPYRFAPMLQKALEMAGELKLLGNALLAALEKKDAAQMAALHASQESGILKAERELKKRQIQETRMSREALERGLDISRARMDHYDALIAAGRIAQEEDQTEFLSTAMLFDFLSNGAGLLRSISAALPQITVTVGPGPMASSSAEWGGLHSSQILAAAGQAFAMVSSYYSQKARGAEIVGHWERRAQDWQLQLTLAQRELLQVEKQIEAAELREEMAQLDLEVHERRIEDAREVERVLRDKFTNDELYAWMVTKTSEIFFQAYKLAYDLAKRAERAYRYELGMESSSFVQFGLWDSLRKGLLTGEQLFLDLKRLESAYLEQNKRRFEITKHISLVLHDSLALLTLKQTGACEVELPELLFDCDYPGHYFRRLHNVSLSIPCVTGPFTSINCTLTLLDSKVRLVPTGDPYAESLDEPDPRFAYDVTGVQSIATSHGQSDSGLFELNFRDERWLPFEGAGAISRWRIELPREENAFDFDTITDIVLTLRYSAKDGGEILRSKAREARKETWAQSGDEGPRPPLSRLLSLRHEFPDRWHTFRAQDPEHPVRAELELLPERFPYRFRGKTIEAQAVWVFLQLRAENDAYETGFDLEVGPSASALAASGETLRIVPGYTMPSARIESGAPFDPRTVWALTFPDGQVLNDVADVWLVVQYSVSTST